MLALSPDRVRLAELSHADDPDRTTGLLFSHPVNRTSQNGTTGTPSRATADQGASLFTMLVEDLATQVRAGLRETPPLPVSYFAPPNSDWEIKRYGQYF